MTRFDVGGTSLSQQWRLNGYPTETAASASCSRSGANVEDVPGVGVIASQVRAGAITTRWKLAPGWAASIALSDHRQDDLRSRTGVRLGV